MLWVVALWTCAPALALIQATEKVPWAGNGPVRSFTFWLAGDVGRDKVGGAAFFSGVQVCPRLVLTSARWRAEVGSVLATTGRRLGRAIDVSPTFEVPRQDRENFVVWGGPEACANVGVCLENYIRFLIEGLGLPRLREPVLANVKRIESHPDAPVRGATADLGEAFHDVAALFLAEALPQTFTVRIARDAYEESAGPVYLAGFGGGGRYGERVDFPFTGRFGADRHRTFFPDLDDGSLLPRGSARFVQRAGATPWGVRRVTNADGREVAFLRGGYQTLPRLAGGTARVPVLYSILSAPDVEPTVIPSEGDDGAPWLVPRGESFTLFGLQSRRDSGYVLEAAAPGTPPARETRASTVGLGAYDALTPLHVPENRERILQWIDAPDSGCTPAQRAAAR